MKLLAQWIISAVIFFAIANIVPGIDISGFRSALWIALLWGVISSTLRPILLLLTLPVNILTLGLFTFVVNGFLFWFLAKLIGSFYVESFFVAFIGALLFSFFNALFQRAFLVKMKR